MCGPEVVEAAAGTGVFGEVEKTDGENTIWVPLGEKTV